RPLRRSSVWSATGRRRPTAGPRADSPQETRASRRNSVLDSSNRETAGLCVESTHFEARLCAPAAHFFTGMSMRVARVIPVEVHVEILLECEFVVPKELREVPVNEALDVVGTRLDAE